MGLAQTVIETAAHHGFMIATAESCTGGLIAAALTDVSGSSAVFDRGFVTYSNEAKADMLGVPLEHTQDPGAVSALVAREMAGGAINNSMATHSVAVTGIAGPGGGTATKPVGLVYIATAFVGHEPQVHECRFTEEFASGGREGVRKATVERALTMLLERLD